VSQQRWWGRACAQRLGLPRPPASIAEAVAAVGAIQAQDLAAAELGVRVRTDQRSRLDVAHALSVERSIVRVWSLRGTLHVLAANDVRWILDVLRPALVGLNRARRAQLGLDEAVVLARAIGVVRRTLANGPATRPELASALAGKDLPYAGQATAHVLWRAALDGLVCFGPARDGAETFVLLDDWVPASPARPRDDALLELARRHRRAYGDGTAEDLAVWSGLRAADARRALALLQASEQDPPRTNAAAGRRPVVRLIPAYDGYWLGHRDGYAGLTPAARRQIAPGGGVIRPTVLVDGEPRGTWGRRLRGQRLDVAVDFFADAERTASDSHVQAALKAELADLARFLGLEPATP
jgi:hypothetical protein